MGADAFQIMLINDYVNFSTLKLNIWPIQNHFELQQNLLIVVVIIQFTHIFWEYGSLALFALFHF